MKILDYELNIKPDSRWYVATPTNIAKKFPFYLMEAGMFIAGQRYFTRRSGMEMFLLIETLSGEGELLYGGETYALIEGSVIMFSCMEDHIYRTKSQKQCWEFRWLQFSGCVSDLYELLLYPEKRTVYTNINHTALTPIFEQICEYAQRNDGYSNARVSSLITKYITEILCMRFVGRKVDSEVDRILSEIQEYMKNNLGNKITVAQLADMAHVSKYYFLRIFKSKIGSSPYEYLVNLRINKTKEQLINTNDTLEIIASEVGFSDSKSLITSFKKSTGISPGKYRSYYRGV